MGGITFSGTGNLTTPGLQIITLQGSGTPTTAGNNTFPVTAGTSNCSFTVPVIMGTGNIDPDLSDTAWNFTEGTKAFNGPFFDAFDTTITSNGVTANAIVLLGYTPSTGDTTMQLSMFTTASAVQPGTYPSKFTGGTNYGAFNFVDYRDTARPAPIYTATPATTLANTVITVASYNTTTKIITGTYSGTAMLDSSATATGNITKGKFTARVR